MIDAPVFTATAMHHYIAWIIKLQNRCRLVYIKGGLSRIMVEVKYNLNPLPLQTDTVYGYSMGTKWWEASSIFYKLINNGG